jgi:hypothetical protein
MLNDHMTHCMPHTIQQATYIRLNSIYSPAVSCQATRLYRAGIPKQLIAMFAANLDIR